MASALVEQQIPDGIGQFIANGAYRGTPIYQRVTPHSASAQTVVPSRSPAMRSCETGPPTQRDHHLESNATHGRLGWQKATYGGRVLVETTMGRYKALLGPRLWARHPNAQQTKQPLAWRCLTACWLPEVRPL
ncbi:hypothetical protein WT83_04925 [Burkholderia territorii]|uniref:Transposase n=1 Tax=Burkholderia territorii TaxID=1503055 RepID=A0A108F2R8_9BURK|nr:hypothetical protein [Burkholderia territorii]KWN22017.1 hypothetical protein WT83_04925 [Burkholderia territorii]